MLRRTALLITALTLCPVWAGADEDDYSRSGVYAGAHAAIATSIGFDDAFERVAGQKGRVDTSVGAGARVGYRVLPRLAVEGQFDWVPGFDFTIDNDTKLVDGSFMLASANAKAYAMVESRFQPYVLGGVGYMRASQDFPGGPQDVTAQSFAARMGVGFDGYVTESFVVALDTQYVLPTGDLEDFDHIFVGVGLQYRF